MSKNSVILNWEQLGAEFANLEDKIQSKFFIGLAKELKYWPSNHNKQLQAFGIEKYLDDSDKKELEIFLSCLYYKE